MDNELKILTDNYKIDQLYKNNLFSIKSICQLLGEWDGYTNEEQFRLENLTSRDSRINKHFTYEGEYDSNLTYGELLKSGVETLIEKINKYKRITDKDVFVDVGSGSGKLALHLGIKSNIKTIVGVELLKQRYEYSKFIKNNILPDNKSIFFINKDIIDFDLSIASILFMNNVCFDNEKVKDIYDRLPKGCHIITAKYIKDCKILKEEFTVDVSWGAKLKLYYYIK